jgi:diaminopimelate decarboxylase
MLRDLARGIRDAAARAAERHATPFYLFDETALRETATAWRRAAAGIGGEVFYPYKCHRGAEVLRPLAAAGLGAEVTTVEDLDRAEGLGLSGERIVVHGPAKAVDLLDAGLANGALFVADGREDLGAIVARAKSAATPPRYLLRLSPSSADVEQRQFGLPARELLSLAREARRRGEAAAAGLAFHLGTGIASPRPYLAALAEASSVRRELESLGVATSLLDLGGGFAAPGEARLGADGRLRPPGAGPSMLGPIGARLSQLFGRDVRVLLEPGRAIVSGSVHLVARVLRVKNGTRRAAYLDASRLAHAFWIARGRHPVAVLPARRGPIAPTALAGPLGVGIDLFAESEPLPPLRPGDLVVIGWVGAYNQNCANTWAGAVPPVISVFSLSPRERAGVRGSSPSPRGRGPG